MGDRPSTWSQLFPRRYSFTTIFISSALIRGLEQEQCRKQFACVPRGASVRREALPCAGFANSYKPFLANRSAAPAVQMIENMDGMSPVRQFVRRHSLEFLRAEDVMDLRNRYPPRESTPHIVLAYLLLFNNRSDR